MFSLWSSSSAAVAAPDLQEPVRRPPQCSASLSWLLGLTGPLEDESPASARFRENVESPGLSVSELETWVLEAVQRPDDAGMVRAFQDLVNAVGRRLGLQVHYGAYDVARRDWLPFDGLWWLDERTFAAVTTHAGEVDDLDVGRLERELAQLRRAGHLFRRSQSVLLIVEARGHTREVEEALKRSRLAQSARVLSVDALFEMLSLVENGVLGRGQIPALLRPFDSFNVAETLGFLEAFSRGFEAEPEEEDLLEEQVAEERPHPLPVAFRVPVEPVAAAVPPTPASVQVPVLRVVPPASPGRKMQHLREIFSLFRAGRHEECRAQLEEYLRADRTNPKAWEIYGDLSMRSGNEDEALRAYERVLAATPDRPRVAYRLAVMAMKRKDYSRAQSVLEGLVRANPAESRTARMALAQLFLESGDPVRCQSLCEELLGEGPWDRRLVELSRMAREARAASEHKERTRAARWWHRLPWS